MLYSFFSLLLPPPRSPLFPYTTLFRSSLLGKTLSVWVQTGSIGDRGGTTADVLDEAGAHLFDVPWDSALGEAVLLAEPLEDRKSTRLNSSHLGNSYAVFCLKKKKKI